jgi:proline iminopeptidase
VPDAATDRTALINNTTGHLIADLERLRAELGIARWLLFGASWGSTLGLAYAVTHPERVSEMVLWAVVTTRAKDVHWLTHCMGEVYPEEFDRLLSVLPDDQRAGNIPAAVNALLMSDDSDVCDRAARAWCAWEDRLGTLSGPVQPSPRSKDPQRRLGFARLVTHYFGNHAFLADDAIVGHLDRLGNTPTYLLRGRLDIASPLRSAYEVANGIPDARLEIVEAEPHSGGDDTIDRLIAVLDEYAGHS